MNAISLEEVLDLARARGGHRVSIYLPTHRFAPGTQEEDTGLLKNLLRTAAEELAKSGVRTADADKLLAPARALVDDRPFWLRSSLGLALLIGPEGMHAYQVRGPVAEHVRVLDRYHVRPLLQFVEAHDEFWLLGISQKHVRFFHGSREGLDEVPSEGIPESLAAAMKWDDFEKASLQFHSSAAGASGTSGRLGGRRPAMFHGTGETPVKNELLRFFRAIDQGLHEHLHDSSAPLLLAGVDYLLPIYRESNTYPHLAEEAIVGNPDALTASVVHARALEIIDGLAEQTRQRLAARIEEAWGSTRTTPDPDTIVSSAEEGRVDTLLVTDAVHWWGTFDPAKRRISLHPAQHGGDEDLLDLAALRTLEHGGSVVSFDVDDMPKGEAAIALLRY